MKDLPEGWKILRDGIAEVDEFECWISANRLKGTSIDDQRSLIRDENQDTLAREMDEGGIEIGKMFLKAGNDSFLKDGKFEAGRDTGNDLENVDTMQETFMNLEARKNEGRTYEVQRDVDVDVIAAVEDVKFDRKLVDSFDRKMFDSFDSYDTKNKTKFYTHNASEFDKQVPGYFVPVDSGKMTEGSEMRSAMEMKDVAKILRSAIPSHERSPSGGVVKKRCKGTPKKNPRVSTLRQVFENENQSSSSSIGRVVEQLMHPSTGSLQIKINLGGKERTRQTRDICAGQPQMLLETRPRQGGELASELDDDWASPAVSAHADQLHHPAQAGLEVARHR